MSPLLLVLVLAQTPELTVPPVAPASPSEPAEVRLFAQFVEKHLLAVGASGSGFEVRQRERVFRLQDVDFESAFTLVPDAVSAAHIAHDDFLMSSRLQIAGLSVLGAAIAVTLVSTLVRTIVIPLLIGALIGTGVGLVLSLVALPFALSAQSKFFSAIATYNQGLLELRPPPSPLGGLTLPLRNDS